MNKLAKVLKKHREKCTWKNQELITIGELKEAISKYDDDMLVAVELRSSQKADTLFTVEKMYTYVQEDDMWFDSRIYYMGEPQKVQMEKHYEEGGGFHKSEIQEVVVIRTT